MTGMPSAAASFSRLESKLLNLSPKTCASERLADEDFTFPKEPLTTASIASQSEAATIAIVHGKLPPSS